LYGKVLTRTRGVIRDLCQHKGVGSVEGNLHKDHIHVCLSMPQKHSVANITGFPKGRGCQSAPP
jgi:putative transposase